MTLDEQKAALIARLEAEASRQAAEDRRLYLEGMGFLYLVGVLLASSDVASLADALELHTRFADAADAPALAEDAGMVRALATCRTALLATMPSIGAEVLASCRRAPSQVRADEPFEQICQAVGPHGLVYLATTYAAARIARHATGATRQEPRH